MSSQRIDADTADTLAGVVRLLGRAAELVWSGSEAPTDYVRRKPSDNRRRKEDDHAALDCQV
jgi:hypothetical protein